MLRKLVIVYETERASFATVQKEVLMPARRLTGWLVGKFVWQPVGFMENARRLMNFLQDGDLVIVAGGDALVGMATNAVLLSRHDVTMAVMGYGLTNDAQNIARTKRPVLYGDEFVGGVEEIVRKYEEGRWLEVFPLEVRVNDKRWRYALSHASVGMLAASAMSLDGDEKGHKSKLRARMRMFGWWLKHRRETWLPEATWRKNDEFDMAEVTDSSEVSELATGIEEQDIVEDSVAEVEREMNSDQAIVGDELRPRGTTKAAKIVLDMVDVAGEGETTEADKETVVETGDQAVVKTSNEAVVKTSDEAVLNSRLEAAREYEIVGCEIMVSGELSGDELKPSRGMAGVTRRLGDMKSKKSAHTVDCAVEKIETSGVTTDIGKVLSPSATDIIAVNGLTMGGKWRGGRFYKRPDRFLFKIAKLGGVMGRFGFATRSRLLRIPGEKVSRVQVDFLEPAHVFIQTDNAWEEMTEVKKIEIGKADQSIKLVKS